MPLSLNQPTLLPKEMLHAFLLHEGHGTCNECNMLVCRSCQGLIDKHVFCLGCYTSRAIDPLPRKGALTIAEMHLELKDKYNFDCANDLDILEVEDVFLSIGYMDKYCQQEQNVPFPMYPMYALSMITW